MTEFLPSKFDILLFLDHVFSLIRFSLKLKPFAIVICFQPKPCTLSLVPFSPASSIQYLSEP
jgi:hypothetical protein